MIKVSKRLLIIIKLLFLLSIPSLSFVLSYEYQIKDRIITCSLAFVLMIFLLRKLNIEKIKYKEFGLVVIISGYIDRLIMTRYAIKIPKLIKLVFKYTKIKLTLNITHLLVSLTIFFAICFYVYLFIEHIYPIIKEFFKKLTKVEKRYLIILSIFAIVFSTVVGFSTMTFGAHDFKKNKYDIIYTSDSNDFCVKDVWFHVSNLENDIRQPLFGVFAIPFSIIAHMTSEVLFFVPESFRYELTMTILQYITLAVSTILLGRLVEKKEKDKKYFYILVSTSFPFLLFGLNLEQYVIGLFYVVLSVYYAFQQKEKLNYAIAGATGTLMTSGVLFFLLTKWEGIKDYVFKALKLAFIFVTLMILSGQFSMVVYSFERLEFLMQFMGGSKLAFLPRLEQYLYFVRSLFIAPSGFLMMKSVHTSYEFASYQLIKIDSINIIGIIVLATMLISLIINRKDKIALLSGAWIVFSFLILCVLGWGTLENGLILYSLYFSWAFYILFYKLFKKHKWLILLFVLVFLFFTCRELYNILKFAIEWYPR